MSAFSHSYRLGKTQENFSLTLSILLLPSLPSLISTSVFAYHIQRAASYLHMFSLSVEVQVGGRCILIKSRHLNGCQ